jgi:hypothetical protein
MRSRSAATSDAAVFDIVEAPDVLVFACFGELDGLEIVR